MKCNYDRNIKQQPWEGPQLPEWERPERNYQKQLML